MENENYSKILEKIEALKSSHESLRKLDNYKAFTALCVKSKYYKNPANVCNDSVIREFLVDGTGDGGVDALLSDPENQETSDLVLVQSKYYDTVTQDDIFNAVSKMITFYKQMDQGHYEIANEKVQSRFQTLFSDVGEESKVHFVFFTSAPRKGIKLRKIESLIKDNFNDSRFDLEILFDEDVLEEIKQAESRRPSVEQGVLTIDEPDNALWFDGEQAAIANISAASLKKLYSMHNINLLSKNLRYYIKKKDIDSDINDTIQNKKDNFWFMNNGLTIVCDDFKIDSKEIKLKNFSIVNGGQTTYIISKSDKVSKDNDFFIPCKIIKSIGNSEDEKNEFCLEIAKASNSQKAIKKIDLKSNSPEQIRFANEMKAIGVYYQTKRGEKVPKDYSEDYKNSDLAEVGKLCLAGIFQLPATSRNKPSTIYSDAYYMNIFAQDQHQVALFSQDLLYVDYYFRKEFTKKYDKENEGSDYLPFAHNSRTLCIAYTALASRYVNKNLSEEEIRNVLNNLKSEKIGDIIYDTFRSLGKMNRVFSTKYKEENGNNGIDAMLFDLFSEIIEKGYEIFSIAKESDPGLNESNFLKNDKNYFKILKLGWSAFKKSIEKSKEIFLND